VCTTGTTIAVLTILALVTRFSVEKFAIEGYPWSYTYVQHYIEAFVIGVTVLVVAIPEGLPLAVTLALAYSVRVSLYFSNLTICHIFYSTVRLKTYIFPKSFSHWRYSG